MTKPLEKLIEELVERALDEVNAISAGGASLQPSGQVTGTGGNPLGRDMDDQYEIMWSGDKPKEAKIKEARRPQHNKQGMKFTRYGGLTPRKQKNKKAPTRKGLWAFIFPYFDWWFLSGNFSDIEGRFKKSGKINRNLLKHFYYNGPIFTAINVPGSLPYNDWFLTDTENLFSYLPKQYAQDLKISRKEVGHEPQNIAVARDVYKYGNISTDYYEVFIPTKGAIHDKFFVEENKEFLEEGNPLNTVLQEQIKFKQRSLKEEFFEEVEEELDEINALSTGATVGYTLPLGMKPGHEKLDVKGKKKKRPKRWYDVHKEADLDEEYIGKRGGVKYYQMGGSLPDTLYNRTKEGKPTRDPGVAGLNKKKKKVKYNLKEIFLHEAAKGPEDLPKGVSVDISPYMGGVIIGYDYDASTNEDTAKVSGYVEMKLARDGCLGAYIIYQSKAAKGFGPLLYDLALEIAGTRGVTADRGSVSTDASNVWKYYYEKRSDVTKKPLDDKDDPKTLPKEDDCDLSVSRSTGAISFLDSGDNIKRPWLNYVYYAPGKPNLQKLRQLGKLQIDSKLTSEGAAPHGSADKCPLHGVPTYFYSTGRSLPKHLQENSVHKGAKKWYQKKQIKYKSPYKMSKQEFLDYKEPSPRSGYRLLYHETSNENLYKIAENGLQLSKSRAEETMDIPNTIWATTDKKGWYGRHPLVVFQVPKNEGEPTIEYASSTVMVHRDIDPKDIITIDPVFSTDLGKERLSFFRSNEYAPIYWDEYFGLKSLKEASLPETIDWSKIKKQWITDDLYPNQTEHGLVYYHEENPDRAIAAVSFATVDWEDNKTAHISMIGVNPKWRRQGLGKALMKDVSKEYGYNNIDWGYTTSEGEHLHKSVEKEMDPEHKREDDMRGHSLKEVFLREFNILATAANEASNVLSDKRGRGDTPRIVQKIVQKNKKNGKNIKRVR